MIEEKVKYKFLNYWKYSFAVEIEGKTVTNSGDGDDIYRFDIRAEGEATKKTDDNGAVYYEIYGTKFE